MIVIVTVHNIQTNKYFFTAHSLQPVSEGWVPYTQCLPFPVQPREGYKKDRVDTKEDLQLFYKACGDIEVPNPDPVFKA